MNISRKTNVLVKASLLIALSFILSYFEFPILPAFPWLKIDLAAVPLLLTGFAFGPVVGLVAVGFKELLALFIKSTTGGVGELANFLIVGSYVVTASVIYLKGKNLKSAILGTVVGSVVLTAVAIASNIYILIPLFFPQGMEAAFFKSYVTFGLPVFNLVKGAAISVTGIALFSKVSFLIHKESGFNRENLTTRNHSA
ncbi:MAG TPA: ECF transporter S component [Clostridiaceae bacterium]|nr:ECF transporter S component [Clostridiaceae bacterium]